eukprot:TRINITY_DN534_c1_g3_i2.p1 TRINITY_DN534_c1_g3~~TRINITY_DN534_c1_g3_i2.p1  ORF type:complete len:1016 (-),score=233.74 TRINITY_DN534_c1_g3_i2:791-3838(-)
MADKGKGDPSLRVRIFPSYGFKFGHLSKLGKKIRTWRKRWFVLEDTRLVYYSSPSDFEIQGSIPLQSVQSIVQASDDDTSKPYCFKMIANSKSYLFLTENEKELGEWMTALRAISSLSSNQSVFDRRISRQMETIREVICKVYHVVVHANKTAYRHPEQPNQQKQVLDACSRVSHSTIAACTFAFMTAAKASAAKGGQLPPLINMSKHMELIDEAIQMLCSSLAGWETLSSSPPLASTLPTTATLGLSSATTSTVSLLSNTAPLAQTSAASHSSAGHDHAQRLEDLVQSFLQLAAPFRESSEDSSSGSDSRPNHASAASADRATRGVERELNTHASRRSMNLADISNTLSVALESGHQTLQTATVGGATGFLPKGRELEKVVQTVAMSAKEAAALAVDIIYEALHSSNDDGFLSNCKTTMNTCQELEVSVRQAVDLITIEDLKELLDHLAGSLRRDCAKLLETVRGFVFGVGGETASLEDLQRAGDAFASSIRISVSIVEAVYQQQLADKAIQETMAFIEQTLAEDGKSHEALNGILTNSRDAVSSVALILSGVMAYSGASESLEAKMTAQARSLLSQVDTILSSSHDLVEFIQDEGIQHQYETAFETVRSSIFSFFSSLLELRDGLRCDEILLRFSKSTQDVCSSLQELTVRARSVLASCGKLKSNDALYLNDVNIWDEPADSPSNIVMYNGTNGESIKLATLNKLVERLLPQKTSNVTYMKTFITTYRSFTTPEMLLRKIRQRYNIPRSKLPSSISPDEFRQNYIQPIQLRVYNVLKFWIERSFSDFNEQFLADLTEFIETLKTDGQVLFAEKLMGLLSKGSSQTTERKVTIHELQINTEVDPVDIIMRTSPDELAKHLCLIDFKVFKMIQPVELLNQAWSKPKYQHLARNVLLMAERFNILSHFVATSIVETRKLKDRIALCNKYIEIANALNRYNNFNSLLSLLSGFGNSAVHRLKHTKAGMSKQYLADMEALEALMSSKKIICRLSSKASSSQSSLRTLSWHVPHGSDIY